jgi:hypothetical protein
MLCSLAYLQPMMCFQLSGEHIENCHFRVHSGSVGCLQQDCSQINNPVTPIIPSAQGSCMQHQPLMCCWNTDVCGDHRVWMSGGMCCYIATDYGVGPQPSAQPGARAEPQWRR